MSAATIRPSRSRTRMPSSPNTTEVTGGEAHTSRQPLQTVSQPQSPTVTTAPTRTGRRSLSPIGGAANAMKKFLQRRRGATANGLVISGPFPSTTSPWTPEAEDDEVNMNLPHTSFGQLGKGFYAEKQRGSSSSTSLDSPVSVSVSSPCLSPVSPKTTTSFWGGMTSGRRGRQGRTVSVTVPTAPKVTVGSSPETTPDNSTAAAVTMTSQRSKHCRANSNSNIPYTISNTNSANNYYDNNSNNDMGRVSSSKKNGFRRSLSVDSVHSRTGLIGAATERILATAEAQRTVPHDAENTLKAPQPKSPHPHKLLQLTSAIMNVPSTTASTTGHNGSVSHDLPIRSVSPSLSKYALAHQNTRAEAQHHSLGSTVQANSTESLAEAAPLLTESTRALNWVRPGKKQRAATANIASFSSSSSLSSQLSSSTATTPSPAPRASVTPSPSKSTRFPSGTRSPPYSPSSSTASLPLMASMALGGCSPSSTLSSVKQRPTRRQSESCLMSKAKVSASSRGDGIIIEAATADRKYAKNQETCPVAAMTEDKMLLISNHSSPTQFYDLPETRAKVRRFLTSLSGFEEVLEYGFPSDVAVEDSTDGGCGLGCRYLTLRLTLTPWHARADETELYGTSETQGKQQQFRTMVTKFFSRASSSGPLHSMAASASTAAPTPSPSLLTSTGHGSNNISSTAVSSAHVSPSGESPRSNGNGLETLTESDQELCSTGDIPSLNSREGLGVASNDDSMDSIVDLPPPCHPFEKIEAPEAHETSARNRMGSTAGSVAEPKRKLSKARRSKKPTAIATPSSLVSVSATHGGASPLPSKIPKLLKNRGFKVVNPSSTAAVTTAMTQSATNTLMNSSSVPASTSMTSFSSSSSASKQAVTLAPNPLVTGALPSLQSPPRSVTPSRFMALPENQPPRKGSLTAFSIPISATSAAAKGLGYPGVNGSTNVHQPQLGVGSANASAFDTLTAPTMPARRKTSSPAISNSVETGRAASDDPTPAATVKSSSPLSSHNLLQDGFRIRTPASPSASASPLHWPVYIPAMSTATKSALRDKDDSLANVGLIPVDGFAARSNKRSGLDLANGGLKPLSSASIVSSPVPSAAPSPLPRTQQAQSAAPPPRPPRKRSDQLEKSPLVSAAGTASVGKTTGAIDMTETTTIPKEHDDPPFEDVLLSKPLPPGALYLGRTSTSSAPQLSTSIRPSKPMGTTTATATTTMATAMTAHPLPTIQSDVFFETPAGLPNYQMDYIVPDPVPAPVGPVSATAVNTVSNYIFGPPRDPYQPRTRYVPSQRQPTATARPAAIIKREEDVPEPMAQQDEPESGDHGKTAAAKKPQGSEETGSELSEDDQEEREDDQVWEMVTLPTVKGDSRGLATAQPHPVVTPLSPSASSSSSSSPAKKAATLQAAAAAVAAAATAATRDSSLSLSSPFSEDALYSGISQAAAHRQPRRGITTASMVMAELRRPGQEQYVYGWGGAGVGNGSLDGSLDPASYDEEDLIFGAYDYSYEDEGFHQQQQQDDDDDDHERRYLCQAMEQQDEDTDDDDDDDEEEPLVRHRSEEEAEDENKEKKRRRRMAMDARSETSEATTIYGQARIGIRMRAHHRTSHNVIAVRPHGQVLVIGMAQADGVGQ
ncbi:hypothetical protein BGZ73_004976 [Actinomortierella ambigua]|nr:hypothetical protein BGZ73_004976 [Actinomortierella ambigua]